MLFASHHLSPGFWLYPILAQMAWISQSFPKLTGLVETCLMVPMKPCFGLSHKFVMLVKSLAPKNRLLAPTRGSVDQQATTRAGIDPGSILNLVGLSGSQGVTSSLKVTVRARGVGVDFFADALAI